MTQTSKDKKPKPYHTPQLEIHGQLTTLTQQGGSDISMTTEFATSGSFNP